MEIFRLVMILDVLYLEFDKIMIVLGYDKYELEWKG